MHMYEPPEEMMVRRVTELLLSCPLRPLPIVGGPRRGGFGISRWDVGVLLRRRPDIFAQGDDYRWRLVGVPEEGSQMRFDLSDQERTPNNGDAG
jgi:hypothetical protein